MKTGINDIQLNAFFNLREFMSPDTCQVMLSPVLLDKLTALRGMIGRPIKISSGYRTPERNKAVGGVPESKHMKGQAADFTLPRESIELALELIPSVNFHYWYYNKERDYFHVQVA